MPMKVLLLADIHSNWPALSVIDEDFDECLIVGDLVDYGIDPTPCLEWAQRSNATIVRGNHDHAVAQRVSAKGGSGFRALAAWSRPRHWELLDADHLSWLARLPVTCHVTVGDHTFFLVHATPRDPLDEYLLYDIDAWKLRLESVNADFVCVGHTHIPAELDLGTLTVVNPGSVGQPRDGDPRCSFAVINDGEVEHRRVEYDVEAAIASLQRAGIDDATFALAASVLRTGGRFP